MTNQSNSTQDTGQRLIELAERLEKRAADERQIAFNSAVVADLLNPEFAKWEARKEQSNLYAVRMAVEHRNSAKKDASFADDLEQAAAALKAKAQQ